MIINQGHLVIFDVSSSPTLGKIDVKGSLSFPPGRSATLHAGNNVLVSENGVLSMRPASSSIVHTLKFLGIDEENYQGGHDVFVPSDIGLWVIDNGQLDIQGASKTAWTKARDAIDRGATSLTLGAHPSGWEVGDEISITPTEPPSVGSASFEGFEDRRITTISGATVGFGEGVTRPHPKVNERWTAEVMNLTRNVRLEGAPGGRAHIWIRSGQPQRVNYAQIRHMGPRKFDYVDGAGTVVSQGVPGRYALHFHKSHDGSRGSIVEGTVIRDIGNAGFVPHTSHGITFRDCVGYGLNEAGMWWDDPDKSDLNNPKPHLTHDTVVEGCLIAKLVSIPEYEGIAMSAYAAAPGERNVMRKNVAVGVQGTVNSNGFAWRESEGDGSVWVFEDNVSHNNKVNGIWIWQVTDFVHPIVRLLAYHNGDLGIFSGAYGQNYHFRDSTLYGNGGSIHGAQFLGWHSTNGDAAAHRLDRLNIDAAGQSDYALLLAGRNVIDRGHTSNLGSSINSSTFAGYRKAAVKLAFDFHDFGPFPAFWDLRNNTWADSDRSKDFVIVDKPPNDKLDVHELSRLKVVDSRHGAIELRRKDQCDQDNDAWNACVATLGSAPVDTVAPTVAITSHADGEKVTDAVTVIASASDDVGISRVEFYVDGQLKHTDTTAPYTFRWDTGAAKKEASRAPGFLHTVTAAALDAAANHAVADVILTNNPALPATSHAAPHPSPPSVPVPIDTPALPAPSHGAPPSSAPVADPVPSTGTAPPSSHDSTKPKLGDVNDDGNVGISDVAALIEKWNSDDPTADLDEDGKVGLMDLWILLTQWDE